MERFLLSTPAAFWDASENTWKLKSNGFFTSWRKTRETTQEKISVAEDYFGSGGIFSITVYSGLSLFVVLIAAGIGWEMYRKTKNNKQTVETATVVLEDVETHPTQGCCLATSLQNSWSANTAWRS
ncbi:hypothetical protein OS493_026687 [Desmophyllum pertusum]|uniref:Uncharacterized protein n=1 Tax=Desmophyllum pertusum TaxID=174260 RepID=A0A9X0D7Z5_9CNID|nr:hypothetical protein OS493_026687 [Desmophyllum pertusum]